LKSLLIEMFLGLILSNLAATKVLKHNPAFLKSTISRCCCVH